MTETPVNRQIFRMTGPDGEGLLRCGMIRGPGGKDATERRLATFAMVYVHEGTGEYIDEDGTKTELSAGHLFLRIPGRRHANRFSRNGATRYFLALPAPAYDYFLQIGLLRQNSQPVLTVGVDSALTERFETLMNELEYQNPERLSQTAARILAFATELLSRAHYGAESGTHLAMVEPACRLLGENLHKRIRLPGVARKLKMSYSTFRKQFRRATGLSPGEYRIRRRIEVAQALLCSDDLPQKGIAERLGYADVFAFSRQFKQVTGLSPGAFRRQQ